MQIKSPWGSTRNFFDCAGEQYIIVSRVALTILVKDFNCPRLGEADSVRGRISRIAGEDRKERVLFLEQVLTVFRKLSPES